MFEEKQKELLRHQSQLIGEEIDADGDEIDAIQGNLIKTLAEKLSIRDQVNLKKVQAALKKIEDGSFGTCEDCGEDIPEKRLTALPEAAFCLDCAELQEKNQRQFGS